MINNATIYEISTQYSYFDSMIIFSLLAAIAGKYVLKNRARLEAEFIFPKLANILGKGLYFLSITFFISGVILINKNNDLVERYKQSQYSELKGKVEYIEHATDKNSHIAMFEISNLQVKVDKYREYSGFNLPQSGRLPFEIGDTIQILMINKNIVKISKITM
jgi:hypothetical protein